MDSDPHNSQPRFSLLAVVCLSFLIPRAHSSVFIRFQDTNAARYISCSHCFGFSWKRMRTIPCSHCVFGLKTEHSESDSLVFTLKLMRCHLNAFSPACSKGSAFNLNRSATTELNPWKCSSIHGPKRFLFLLFSWKRFTHDYNYSYYILQLISSCFNIQVLFQADIALLSLQYAIQNDPNRPVQSGDRYIWKHDNNVWSPCSTTCGRGNPKVLWA